MNCEFSIRRVSYFTVQGLLLVIVIGGLIAALYYSALFVALIVADRIKQTNFLNDFCRIAMEFCEHVEGFATD